MPLSDKERIAGLIKALNEVADWAEGNREPELARFATEAVRRYGSATDAQRGLFGVFAEAS